ncbi:MAG: hypothetical protein ACI9MC_000163 [Kiritimatiellia bacterium]|jgi:hypothetical protein
MNDAPKLELYAPYRLRAGRALLWGVFGVLLGGVAPGAVAIMFMDFGLFSVGSALVGLLVGVAIGHLEPAARLRRLPLAARWGGAVLLGPALGFVWGGLAGIAGGAMLAAWSVIFGMGMLGAGGDWGSLLLIGGVLGAVVGTVPVSIFLWVRLALFDRLKMVWIAPVAALILTPVASATLFMPAFLAFGALVDVVYRL